MQIIETIEELNAYLTSLSTKKQTLGFVPTMGALHEGHLSLIKRAKSENNHCLSSIFVNPTQFNNDKDLENYPRRFERDVAMLQSAGCDAVFHPSYELMYPNAIPEAIALGDMESTMEGKFRPGHFQGVVAVVRRFFDLVRPQKAYFGLKDFQQYAVIQFMVRTLKIPVEVI
jgi:pantoate--beta-alanine ligase